MINDDDFQGLTIPVHNAHNVIAMHKELIEKIFGQKKFQTVKNTKRKDLDLLVKYVVYMYDKKSPMRRYYSDIDQRKTECAILAGYDTDENNTALEKIFNFTDEVAKYLVTEYIKYINDKIWAVLQGNEEVLWQYNQELLNPITDFKTDK